ncbi:MAG: hypothetical protein KC516_00130 [Nanoarchaeota archaeon]|nr:hypothetical protein [Nanoarchaeota archaeon]
MTTNTREIKNKIINSLKSKGPLLPAYVSKEIGMDMLFTSAFLSELISEKEVYSSHMRVGSSAIYYLEDQKNQLEKYQEHIKGKEKEALQLLKEKSFLEDETQEAPIRVALRQIKDFAIPFEHNDKIIWRYFLISEKDYPHIEIKKEETNLIKEKEEIKEINKIKDDAKEKPKENLEKSKGSEKGEQKPSRKFVKKKLAKKTASQKKNEKFFDKVKNFLSEKGMEIIGIEGFSKSDLILTIKKNNEDYLLVAFNKKKISEVDILKAHKKATEEDKKYMIFSLGDLTKKLENFIEAIRNLSNIEKIE